MRSIRSVGFVLALLGLSAAANATEPTTTDPSDKTGTPTTMPTTTPGSQPMPGEEMAPTAYPEQQAGLVEDSQIVGMLAAVNTSEIAQARYVVGKTTNAEVKRFAQSVLDDHLAVQKKVETWSKTSGKKAADSRMQTDFASKAKNDLTRLNGLTGDELDRGYIEHAVMTHQNTLDLVDTQMVVEVDDPALKALLRDVRPKLQQHLEMAQSLRTSMGGKDMNGPPATTPRPGTSPTSPPTSPPPTSSPNPSGY